MDGAGVQWSYLVRIGMAYPPQMLVSQLKDDNAHDSLWLLLSGRQRAEDECYRRCHIRAETFAAVQFEALLMPFPGLVKKQSASE